jgi:two-component system response regulator AtoC
MSVASLEYCSSLGDQFADVVENCPSTGRKFTVLRILIVDDEPLIRWSLAETLINAGHLVEEAGTAKQTVEALAAGSAPDVVLLDFRMPDSKDLKLLETIRRTRPGSAVIMMTAFGTPEMVADAERLGVYQVLSKPIDMTDLPALVQQSHAARIASNNPH